MTAKTSLRPQSMTSAFNASGMVAADVRFTLPCGMMLNDVLQDYICKLNELKD